MSSGRSIGKPAFSRNSTGHRQREASAPTEDTPVSRCGGRRCLRPRPRRAASHPFDSSRASTRSLSLADLRWASGSAQRRSIIIEPTIRAASSVCPASLEASSLQPSARDGLLHVRDEHQVRIREGHLRSGPRDIFNASASASLCPCGYGRVLQVMPCSGPPVSLPPSRHCGILASPAGLHRVPLRWAE